MQANIPAIESVVERTLSEARGNLSRDAFRDLLNSLATRLGFMAMEESLQAPCTCELCREGQPVPF